MIFWRYTALFFSAIALLSLQKMPSLSPKSLSQNAELILCPLLNTNGTSKLKPKGQNDSIIRKIFSHGLLRCTGSGIGCEKIRARL